MKTMALIVACFCTQLAHAEHWEPVKAFSVGVGMILLPIAVNDKDLTWMHSMEIQGCTYAATDIGFAFFGPDLAPASPALVELFCFGYRIIEIKEDPAHEGLYLKKLALDSAGVAACVIMNLHLDKDLTVAGNGDQMQVTWRF